MNSYIEQISSNKKTYISNLICWLRDNVYFFSNLILISFKLIAFSLLIYGDTNKTYIVFSVLFTMALISFSFLFTNIFRIIYPTIVNLIISVLLIIDMAYYKAFETLPSIVSIKEVESFNNLASHAFTLLDWRANFFIVDIIIIFIFSMRKIKVFKKASVDIGIWMVIIFISVPIPFTYIKTNSEEAYCMSALPIYFTPIQYHISDVCISLSEGENILLSDEQKKSIKNWFAENEENLSDNKYKGFIKDKNVIFIQFESLEQFVINKRINNQEITPILNSLLNNSLYFSNIHEQINLGSSSDAHFMLNTSLYPTRKGCTFYNYASNTYISLPKMLNKNGYKTMAIYPVQSSFWNWGNAMASFGFSQLFDSSSYNIKEQIGMGISDRNYFEQIAPILKTQKQPFYAEIANLSSHMPFKLPQKYRDLKLDKEVNDSYFGGYLQSIHYADEQVGYFLSLLKENDLLKNTVVVICGDHCGVHKYYNDSILKIKNHEEWWTENNNKVPLIIYGEDIKAEEMPVIGGQVDILPTLCYAMGIDKSEYADSSMGRNLLNTKKSFAVLSDGNYIGENPGDSEKNHDIEGLNISDLIIRGNYFNNNIK